MEWGGVDGGVYAGAGAGTDEVQFVDYRFVDGQDEGIHEEGERKGCEIDKKWNVEGGRRKRGTQNYWKKMRVARSANNAHIPPYASASS